MDKGNTPSLYTEPKSESAGLLCFQTFQHDLLSAVFKMQWKNSWPFMSIKSQTIRFRVSTHWPHIVGWMTESNKVFQESWPQINGYVHNLSHALRIPNHQEMCSAQEEIDTTQLPFNTKPWNLDKERKISLRITHIVLIHISSKYSPPWQEPLP